MRMYLATTATGIGDAGEIVRFLLPPVDLLSSAWSAFDVDRRVNPDKNNTLGFVDPATAMAIASGVTAVGSAIFGWIGRRGRQKVAATQIVDEAERLLEQNLRAYLEAPPLEANRQQAIDNFEQIWRQVLSSCSDPSLGDAGRRCISERQRGGQWDWFARYRDPIAEDERLANSAAGTPGANFLPAVIGKPLGGSPLWWLVPAGLIGLALAL